MQDREGYLAKGNSYTDKKTLLYTIGQNGGNVIFFVWDGPRGMSLFTV